MADNKDISGVSDRSVQFKDEERLKIPIECSERRRRIIKGAALVTPLMMTVASRPVLGGQCTPSAWVSGNLSDPSKDRPCGGRSPGYWKTKPDRWCTYDPGECEEEDSEYTRRHWRRWRPTCTNYDDDEGTLFYSAFGVDAFPGETMMQVLWKQGYNDKYKLGAHLVAALLNAACIQDYQMSETVVKDMASQLYYTGQYCSSPGICIESQEEAVRFIQNTFS